MAGAAPPGGAVEVAEPERISLRELHSLGQTLLAYGESHAAEVVLTMVAEETRAPPKGPRLVPTNLFVMPPERFDKFTRFTQGELVQLVRVLRLPSHEEEPLQLPNRARASPFECFAVLCARLAFPSRWLSMEHLFRRHERTLRAMMSWAVTTLVSAHGHLLEGFDRRRLATSKLRSFAAATADKGAPLSGVWAFIDGHGIEVSRPRTGQRECYNGHDRCHTLRWQGLTTPDGIIVEMAGPFTGSTHDATMFRESGLLGRLESAHADAELEAHEVDPTVDEEVLAGRALRIYGDAAYALSPHVFAPFKDARTDLQLRWNAGMASCRISVEWSFGKLHALFSFLSFYRCMYLLHCDVNSWVVAATLLANCHTCLRGSQTAMYFNVDPPTLEEYLWPSHHPSSSAARPYTPRTRPADPIFAGWYTRYLQREVAALPDGATGPGTVPDVADLICLAEKVFGVEFLAFVRELWPDGVPDHLLADPAVSAADATAAGPGGGGGGAGGGGGGGGGFH